MGVSRISPFELHEGSEEMMRQLIEENSQYVTARILCEQYDEPQFTRSAVLRRLRKLGLLEETTKATPKKSIEEFLVTGKRVAEIENYFGKPVDEVVANIPTGYDLFQTLDHFHQKVYVLLPKVQVHYKVKPRVWTYRWATDENGEPQPYLWVQFPDTNWKKIKVVPLADLHYGSNASDDKLFREWVNWIKSRDDVFVFINGDLFENAHGDSNHGVAMYEQDVRPKTQVEDVISILAPIAHKILWAIPGNHEDRSRTRDYDPLEYLCRVLDIPYSYEAVYADLLWKEHVFSFFCQHGKTNSQTKGGKFNAAARPQKFQEFTMFTCMAHVHDAMSGKNIRICRDRVNFRLEFMKQYVIICPSFYGYFGSYASKAVYEPGAKGTTNCELFANGDYHVNE